MSPLYKYRIYVAGPITKGDVGANCKQAFDAGMQLLKHGFAPLIPHGSCVWGGEPTRFFDRHGDERTYFGVETLPQGTTHADWLGICLPWVAVADAVLRLPGESVGSDREVAEAKRLNIPVWYSMDALLEWAEHVDDNHLFTAEGK